MEGDRQASARSNARSHLVKKISISYQPTQFLPVSELNKLGSVKLEPATSIMPGSVILWSGLNFPGNGRNTHWSHWCDAISPRVQTCSFGKSFIQIKNVAVIRTIRYIFHRHYIVSFIVYNAKQSFRFIYCRLQYSLAIFARDQ